MLYIAVFLLSVTAVHIFCFARQKSICWSIWQNWTVVSC